MLPNVCIPSCLVEICCFFSFLAMIAGAGFWLAGFGELVCWMVGLLGCRVVVMSGGLLAGCWLDGLLAG